MAHWSRFGSRLLAVVSSALLAAGAPVLGSNGATGVCVETPPVDHPCVADPVFPADCVEQLGAIGEPVLPPAAEGYLGIAAPVVDPILRLRTADDRDGRIYALNPADNTVRVFDATDLEVVADVRVCYRPSALAQSSDGEFVFVSCHASHAVGLIDTTTQVMVDLIQDRDPLGRPRLQEPMGLVMSGDRLYVASSQNNRIAVIDPATRRVLRYIPLPGQDPRALTVSPDGAHLIVANFLAGNRTEPARPSLELPPLCQSLLDDDPTAQAVFDESSPTFMDTSHTDYPTIAECYFLDVLGGATETVVRNPARPDHDLVVVRLDTEQVVFTTDGLAIDPGTLNYDVAFDPAGPRVYLATVHARNDQNAGFGKRPLVNRLVAFDFDAASGALSFDPSTGIRDLDAPYLDACGEGHAEAATPYALALDGNRVLIAATGSDRLVVTDKAGTITATLPVGFGPKGVVLAGDTAFVYNALGFSVSRVDLVDGTSFEAGVGPSRMPQTVRIGARLFNSAALASNGTFACASCHPDGHLDGLVWRLNDQDKLRSTMTLQEIGETAAYHWDGSKCNLVKILEDGIVNLFDGPAPSDCETKTMIDFMNTLVKPHSPFRPSDDSMTDAARLGSAVFHRATSKDAVDVPRSCNSRPADLTVESTYLEAVGDPLNPFFAFNGAAGPVPNTTDSESCSVANCHVAPHTESDGFVNGNPDEGLIDGFQAVSTLGGFDRMVTMHDSRTTRTRYVEALDVNRTFNGEAPVNPNENFTGRVALTGFIDGIFRHKEYNFDENPATNAFALSGALTQFVLEEEELQPGTVGLTAVLRRPTPAETVTLIDRLESAADQGKIVLVGVGTIDGAPAGLTWQPGMAGYLADGGTFYTRQELQQALTLGDVIVLHGGLLPQDDALPNPKLRAVLRDGSPYPCFENYPQYAAAALVGETDVTLTLRGIDVVDGTKVLVDGQVTGASLAGGGPDFTWTLPATPAEETVLTLQFLAPNGMLSNSLPLPVVDPVVPATEPTGLSAFKGTGTFSIVLWDNQFGITGPGTVFNVFRGLLSELHTDGLGAGNCFTANPTPIFGVVDNSAPPAGDGFYYLARAETSVNVTTWGSADRDARINAAPGACPPAYP